MLFVQHVKETNNVNQNQQKPLKKPLLSRKGQVNFWGYTFVTPALLVFIVFTVVPIILAISLSMTNIKAVHSTKYQFVGLNNFLFIFRTNTQFWSGMRTILLYLIVTVPLTLTGSMILALIIRKQIFGTKFFRGLFYLPGITSGVATAMVWNGMLNKDGIVNNIIDFINKGFHAIFSTNLIPNIIIDTPGGNAIWGIILMTLWGGLGGNMVLFLAGMNAIPESIYEAAEMDGASKIRRFFSITLPLMKPSLFFALTLSLIGTMQMFEPLVIMNVDGQTTTPVHQIYLNSQTHMGLATAQSLVLFVFIMIITFAMQKTNKERFF